MSSCRLRPAGLPETCIAGAFAVVALCPFDVPAQDAADTSREETFERLFGDSEQRIPAATYPLFLRSRNLRDLRVVPRDGQFLVDAEPFLQALRDRLRPDVYRERFAVLEGSRQIPLSTVRQRGVDASFDRQRLAVVVEIPAALRKRRTLSLGADPQPPGNLRAPEPFSFFLNTGISAESQENGRFLPSQQDGVELALDGALNMDGVVLSSDATYEPNRSPGWQRGFTRLTKDFPEDAIRARAGDIIPATTGFQSSRAAGGIRIGRTFSLRPFEDFSPTGQRDFRIQSRSEVTVVVNGVEQTSFVLPPGRYRLEDLPVDANTRTAVQLIIEDDFGNVRRLSFPLFFSNQLLEPGTVDFEVAVGAPRGRGPDGRVQYNSDTKFATGFARLGLSQTATLGVNAQADPNVSQLGADGVWASPIGTFSSDISISEADFGTGAAGTLQYTIADPFDRNVARTINLSATTQSRNFAAIGTDSPSNPVELSLSGGYSQQVGDATSLSLTGSYEFSRDDTADDYTGTASVSRSIGGAFVGTQVSYDRSDGRGDLTAQVFISFTFGPRSFGSSTYDSENNRVRTRLSTRRTVAGRSINATATATRSRTERSGSGSVNYTGRRFVANAGTEIDLPTDDRGGTRTRTVVGVQTALVAAGDSIAISRPVTDSFAIVAPSDNAPDFDLAIGPERGPEGDIQGYEYRSDFLGPPVVTGLISYIPNTIEVEAPDAPLGASLGGQTFQVRPTFKSGFDFDIGSERNVAVIGTLLKPDGSPVVRRSGTARLVGGDEEISFFTNQTGRFYIEGARAGERYRLSVAGLPLEAVLEVPGEALGTLRVGELRASQGGEQ